MSASSTASIDRYEPAIAMRHMRELTRFLAGYAPSTIWEVDTAAFPGPLQQYRRSCRIFAQSWLKPYALTMDAIKNSALRDVILREAGKGGFLSDMLPWPLGAGSPGVFLKPLHFFSAIKMEELCAACGGLGLMIGAHGLGMAPIVLSGEVAAWWRFAVPMNQSNLRGDIRIAAYAITEPAAGSDVEDTDGARLYRPKMRARRVPGGWSLTGRKVFISGGDIADSVCVFAALEDEGMDSWTCFLVRKGMPGFALGRNELKMGQRASSASELVFEDVVVPDNHVIGGLRNGWSLNRTVLNYSRMPVGAIALGIARNAFEAALEFAAAHSLAGRKLADYQEIQLMLARMFTLTSAMRSMIWDSASTWTARQYKASAVKVFCSDTAMQVCELAMELMGNHGLSAAHTAEKAYRDARLTQIYEGTNQINLLGIIEDQHEEIMAYARE